MEQCTLTGKCTVEFCNDHTGHKIDFDTLMHTPLRNSVKRAIAVKLLLGIPNKEIIEEIKESSTHNRTINITNQDLRNISVKYGIDNLESFDTTDAAIEKEPSVPVDSEDNEEPEDSEYNEELEDSEDNEEPEDSEEEIAMIMAKKSKEAIGMIITDMPNNSDVSQQESYERDLDTAVGLANSIINKLMNGRPQKINTICKQLKKVEATIDASILNLQTPNIEEKNKELPNINNSPQRKCNTKKRKILETKHTIETDRNTSTLDHDYGMMN
ncbi:unnamed protein product [Meganyctiphanes norvegica]|uniref:Uncharacterized protein n=1 Tax=Meganyctiphanes norvegica TaxID=48144 RepID=A0AAV2RWU9_MEGNR